MTEYDLFINCIPMIAEIAVKYHGLDRQEYDDWKQETLDTAPETARTFIEKVFIVIDSLVLKGGVVA